MSIENGRGTRSPPISKSSTCARLRAWPCQVVVTRLPDGETGWLAGLRDPHIARALALLHRNPNQRWTVDDLGREVGLSRSALADRFIRMIGMPPMQDPGRLAHAGRDSEAPQHQRVPRADCRNRRLRLRGRILSRLQKGARLGASHMATLEQLSQGGWAASPRTLDTDAPDLHDLTAWTIWAGVTAPICVCVFSFRRHRKIMRCGRAPAHSAAAIVRAWFQIPRAYSRFGLMTGRW